MGEWPVVVSANFLKNDNFNFRWFHRTFRVSYSQAMQSDRSTESFWTVRIPSRRTSTMAGRTTSLSCLIGHRFSPADLIRLRTSNRRLLIIRLRRFIRHRRHLRRTSRSTMFRRLSNRILTVRNRWDPHPNRIARQPLRNLNPINRRPFQHLNLIARRPFRRLNLIGRQSGRHQSLIARPWGRRPTGQRQPTNRTVPTSTRSRRRSTTNHGTPFQLRPATCSTRPSSWTSWTVTRGLRSFARTTTRKKRSPTRFPNFFSEMNSRRNRWPSCTLASTISISVPIRNWI